MTTPVDKEASTLFTLLIACAGCASAPSEAPPPGDAPLADHRFITAFLECPEEVERGSEGPVALSVVNGLSTDVELFLDGCRKHERLGNVASTGSRGFVLPRRYTMFGDVLRIHVFRDPGGQRYATFDLHARNVRYVPLSLSRSRARANARSPDRDHATPSPSSPEPISEPGHVEGTFAAGTTWSVAGGAALTLSCRPNEGPTLVLSPGRRFERPLSISVSFDGGEFVPTTDSWARVRSATDAFVAAQGRTRDLLERIGASDLIVLEVQSGKEEEASRTDRFVFVAHSGSSLLRSDCIVGRDRRNPPPSRGEDLPSWNFSPPR